MLLRLVLACAGTVRKQLGPLTIRKEDSRQTIRTRGRAHSRRPSINTQTSAIHFTASQPTQSANELSCSRLTETNSARCSLECAAIAKVIPTLDRRSSQAFLPAPCACETKWKPARLGALATGDAGQPGRPYQTSVLSQQQDRTVPWPGALTADRAGLSIS